MCVSNKFLRTLNVLNSYNNKFPNYSKLKFYSSSFKIKKYYPESLCNGFKLRIASLSIITSRITDSYKMHSYINNKPAKLLFSTLSNNHKSNVSTLSRIWLFLPKSFHPYLLLLRLDKPIGVYLLFLPCIFSIALGMPIGEIPSLNFFKEIALFGIGALVMRGAGCIINDLWDRKIDKLVTRTKLRPIAAGDITVKNAIIWLGVQLSLGLFILLQLNFNSILLGICSLPFVVIYPYMKRFFPVPQLVLGITFNWGALVGYVAITNTLPISILSLYIPCVLWTIYYDTIYAVQDRASDLKIGVRSSALTFGKYLVPVTTAFGYSSIIGFSSMGYFMGLGSIYQAGVLVALAHMQYQLQIWQPRPISELLIEHADESSTNIDLNEEVERQNSSKIFIMNKWFGLIIASSIVADRYYSDLAELKKL